MKNKISQVNQFLSSLENKPINARDEAFLLTYSGGRREGTKEKNESCKNEKACEGSVNKSVCVNYACADTVNQSCTNSGKLK